MGVDANGLRFLLSCRAGGADFGELATLGRQQLHLDEDALLAAARAYDAPITPEPARAWLADEGHFAEGLFSALGARSTTSFDASGYEGASVVADLNLPLDERWHGRFSTVFDGGTLEHVFDAPRALRSCMELVRPGGHLLTITTADGYFGHGFYQFSSEFFHRVLDERHGFALERVLVCDARGHWFEVADGAAHGRRATLCAPRPTLIHVAARRVSSAPVPPLTAAQSDYEQRWTGEVRDTAWTPPGRRARLRRRLAGDAAFDPRFFRRVRL